VHGLTERGVFGRAVRTLVGDREGAVGAPSSQTIGAVCACCSDEVYFSAVIAGHDPAIPITWHSRAILSGMVGSSPAKTIQERPNAF
jgi:hypothetical protein